MLATVRSDLVACCPGTGVQWGWRDGGPDRTSVQISESFLIGPKWHMETGHRATLPVQPENTLACRAGLRTLNPALQSSVASGSHLVRWL